MGQAQGTQSRTTVNVLNEMCTNIIMKSSLSCITQATQNQLMLIANVSGNVDLNNVNLQQGSTIDVNCLMSAEKQTEMAQSAASQMAQYASSQGEAALSALGTTVSDASTNIRNKIQNNIDASTETEIKSALTQNQMIKVVNVGGNVLAQNVSMQQQASLVAKAMVTSKAYSSVINDTADKIDQSAQSKETNPLAVIWGTVLGGVGKIFSGPGFIIIVIAALGIGGLLLFLRSGGSLSAFTTSAPPPTTAAAAGTLSGGGFDWSSMMKSIPKKR